ncbi:DUF4437 domain-containing protein [Pseudoalteromonas phenolica]|uniref:DUF4437 domain-containing protein n=1 Tax=Pseudoalteromonas phenolica TaxID=161398 RepID=UPI00110B8B01|nr:DUF4437 domain-containing protein [Pseudoalteromonas phenolica]TMO58244.1 hypothetical protein CWC21_00755 [Pseudoalteromonas phenolica]
MRHVVKTLVIVTFFLTFISTNAFTAELKVIKAQSVEWGYLNPLRGAKSPGAAELWGDRTKNNATGMLVRFKKGFSSPPHIHNISYRGIVIKGLIHNADPNAEHLWMPSTSYWTQPAGGNHITAANGDENLIYLEIDSGPYLVKPSEKQFNNQEYPLNFHADNLVWQSADELTALKTRQAMFLAPLWQSNDGRTKGQLLKLPADFSGNVHVMSEEFKAVIIQGAVNLASSKDNDLLEAGSYIELNGVGKFNLSSLQPAILYIRSNGEFDVRD